MTTRQRNGLTRSQNAMLARGRQTLPPGHRPLLIHVNGVDKVVDGETYPAHLRSRYGVSTLGRVTLDGVHVKNHRKRPHRNAGKWNGGQRGNGARHDGVFNGHGAGKKLTEGW